MKKGFGQKPRLFFVGIGEWISVIFCGILVAKPERDCWEKRGENMGRNRRIVFGYKMANGEICTEPLERQAVEMIFKEYISGNSLKTIGRELNERNVEYYKNEPAIWNASMIKRIIENKSYLGTWKYPQIIEQDIFDKANQIKSQRANNISIVPDRMKAIQNLIVCKECGKKLFRNYNGTWNCKAQRCRRFSYSVTDQMIESYVVDTLNAVIAAPGIPEPFGRISTYSPNSHVKRQQNEINRLIDTKNIDYEKVVNEMIKLAQIKYDCCSYNEKAQQTENLKSMLIGHDPLDESDMELAANCIKRITVDHYGMICLELINDIRPRTIIERNGVDNE